MGARMLQSPAKCCNRHAGACPYCVKNCPTHYSTCTLCNMLRGKIKLVRYTLLHYIDFSRNNVALKIVPCNITLKVMAGYGRLNLNITS